MVRLGMSRLELGNEVCGHKLITGTQLYLSGQDKVASITCSDFLQTNRDYVKRFLASNNTSEGFGIDWEKFATWAFKQDGTRLVEQFKRKYGKFEMFDMTKLSSFEALRNDSGGYDVITSEYALCEGTQDLEGYEAVIGEVNKLLKVGGTFLLMDLLRQTYWAPDPNNSKTRCPTVWVDIDWLKGVLMKQGFRVEQASIHYCHDIPSEAFNAEGYFALWATKIN